MVNRVPKKDPFRPFWHYRHPHAMAVCTAWRFVPCAVQDGKSGKSLTFHFKTQQRVSACGAAKCAASIQFGKRLPGGKAVSRSDVRLHGGDRGGEHRDVVGEAEAEYEIGNGVGGQYEVGERRK